jgi:hypothetical protein
MSVELNYPQSLDMMAKKAAVPAEPLITRFRSDNATYGAGDIVRIEISTGGRNQFLLPTDSFLSFDFVSTHTATGGNLRIDGSAYSIFRRARVIHGSTTIIDIQNCGRLWNALRDAMVNYAARSVDAVRLAADVSANQMSANNYVAGRQLASGVTYDAAFCLPLGLVGSLSKTATPLGLMGASSIFIELEIAPHAQIVTTREYGDAKGSAGTVTSLALSSFVLSNIYYNAKITTLDEPYAQALMSAYSGRPLVLPATDYIGEMKVVAAGASTINEKFAFSRSSVNGMLWWLSNSTVANGIPQSDDLAEGTCHRQGGNLSEYYVAVSGKNLLSIYAGAGPSGYFKGATSVSQIGRIYNNLSSVDGMGILNFGNYCDAADTYALAIANTKRFIGAYSLERYDADSKYASGSNLVGQDVRLVAQMTTALSEQQNLFGYAMCDVGFQLVDGQLNLLA